MWVQWVSGHLPDHHFVAFLGRCRTGLKPGGLVVVKENVASGGFVLDKADSFLTRSEDHFMALFSQAGYCVLRRKVQKNFPKELFAVIMYSLKPAA